MTQPLPFPLWVRRFASCQSGSTRARQGCRGSIRGVEPGFPYVFAAACVYFFLVISLTAFVKGENSASWTKTVRKALGSLVLFQVLKSAVPTSAQKGQYFSVACLLS